MCWYGELEVAGVKVKQVPLQAKSRLGGGEGCNVGYVMW